MTSVGAYIKHFFCLLINNNINLFLFQLTIVLRMDDKMNRQLTSCISPADNPKVLAQELVHYGFINEVSISNMVFVFIVFYHANDA